MQLARRARWPFVFPMVALLAAVAAGENPDWANVARSFAEQFRTKGDVELKQRRSAVNALARSQDGRAVDLLLGAVDDQARLAAKLRKEWKEAEDAWQEKTNRLDKRVDEKRRQNRERGEDTTYLDKEEADWLGTKDRTGAMWAEKDKLAKRFAVVAEEEGLLHGILRAVARVVNSIEGEESSKATARAVAAAAAARGELRFAFLRALGYARGDAVTDHLQAMASDANAELAQTALEALGRQNTERGADHLIARLQDPRWQIRASAITGLSFYRNGKLVGKVMDALLAQAKKEEGVLQRNFFVGMARIAQEAVPATVEAWESWWRANREDLVARLSARAHDGQPIEDDPQDVLVETHQGSSSFYGITTNSKHIIYVVDVSGSMMMDARTGKRVEGPDARRRIDVMREELKKAVQSLPSKDGDERGEASFNIVTFATDVTVYRPGKMIDVTRKAKEEAVQWVEKIEAINQTNIYDALEQAFNVISATSDAKNLSKGADTIFLMTDGKPNRGKFFRDDLIIEEVRKMNATRKITIHTIGVGEGHDARFLKDLAAANGGQYVGR